MASAVSISHQRSFDYADRMLRNMHRYPILEHKDAVFLADKLDECIYNLVRYVSKYSQWFKNEYICIAESYIVAPADRNSFAATKDDSALVSSLFWVADNSVDWLSKVQNDVTLFRAYWIRSITSISTIVATYCDDAVVPSEDEDYIHARERCSKVEETLGVSSDIMYGIANEISYWSGRIDKIVNKLTCPYFRRVAVLAKQCISGKPEHFLDNLNAGVEGINVALGRYHTSMGSYAGLVDTWIRNRMLTWVRKASNPIRVPDRVFAHKREYETYLKKNPNATDEDVAKHIGIKSTMLRSSLELSSMQSTSQLLDENDSDDYGSGFDAYLDTSFVDSESVNNVVLEYGSSLSNKDRAFLTLLLDCDVDGIKISDKSLVRRETIRQLLISHRRKFVAKPRRKSVKGKR